MTFEDWVERSIPMTDQEKTFAWFAWKAATEAEREATLDKVLTGLRSENDTTQLRAIIASVEAMRSNA